MIRRFNYVLSVNRNLRVYVNVLKLICHSDLKRPFDEFLSAKALYLKYSIIYLNI